MWLYVLLIISSLGTVTVIDKLNEDTCHSLAQRISNISGVQSTHCVERWKIESPD